MWDVRTDIPDVGRDKTIGRMSPTGPGVALPSNEFIRGTAEEESMSSRSRHVGRNASTGFSCVSTSDELIIGERSSRSRRRFACAPGLVDDLHYEFADRCWWPSASSYCEGSVQPPRVIRSST